MTDTETNYDYETTAEAEAHLATMFDMSTIEGQRQRDHLLSIASIREDDEDEEEAQPPRVDMRIPVTVVFDVSLYGIRLEDIEKTVDRLRDAVVEADLESPIKDEFDGEIAFGTPYVPVRIDEAAIGFRRAAKSGSFDCNQEQIARLLA